MRPTRSRGCTLSPPWTTHSAAPGFQGALGAERGRPGQPAGALLREDGGAGRADPYTPASVRAGWPAWVAEGWQPRPAVPSAAPLASSRPPGSTAASGPQRGLPGPARPAPSHRAGRPPARLGPAPHPGLPPASPFCCGGARPEAAPPSLGGIRAPAAG